MLEELIKKLEIKRKKLDSLRPIDIKYMENIREKFEIDFNYYSNSIEGNTLTKGETNSLIKLNLNATIAKRQRDIQEMSGHIEAANFLDFYNFNFNSNSIPNILTQNFIKNLHKLIFVEDEIKYSYQDGQKRSAVLKAGEYKQFENSVIQPDGNVFEYISAHETPSLMTDLVDWYNIQRDKIHPVTLAAIFHYKFIRIHPFGDGNGRMARLLMNYILQSSGYSIVIVTTDDKPNYINSLDLTNNNFTKNKEFINSESVDDFEPFVSYIFNLEIAYLNTMIKGAMGDELLEVDDIIKQATIRKEGIKNNITNKDKIIGDPQILELANNQNKHLLNKIKKYFDAIGYTSSSIEKHDNIDNFKKITLNFLNEKNEFLVTMELSYNEIKKNIHFDFGYSKSPKNDNINEILEYVDQNYELKTKDIILAIDKIIKKYDN